MGTKTLWLAVSTVLLALPAWAQDQATEERLEQLEKQNQEILDRLKESEERNEQLNKEVGTLRTQGQELLEREIADYLDNTEQLEGGGPKQLETKNGAFLTIYGFLRLDLYYNTGLFNSVIVPVLVRPETGGRHNDDEFAFDVRLTRIGFDFNLGQIGNLKATGKLEIDFANFPAGVPESRETPRIRLAYFQLDSGTWFLGFGQYWDIISPLYPNANNEGVMWLVGNLGDRRPMIRWFYRGKGSITVDLAIGMTGAINNQDLDSLGVRDGLDAGFPHGQVRVAWSGSGDKKIVIGVWGFAGGMETDTDFGGKHDFTTWAGGLDFTIPVGAMIVLRGEAWFGSAAGDIRGNIGQTINMATGDPIEGPGGWAEVVLRPNEGLQFYVGGTIDDPHNATVPNGAPTKNFAGYVGVRRHWSKRFRTTFDVIYWETQYSDDTLGNALRFNIWTSWDF